MKILLTANSPGEVAWVEALATGAADRGWSCDVLLYPCTFATGQEAQVLRGLRGVEQVWTTSQLPRLLWRSPYPRGTPLIHLGGDLMYTALLSWRHGWSCWSYLWARPWWDRFFVGYFSRNAASTAGILRRRVAPSKIHETGDLIVDAARRSVAQSGALPRDPGLISFLPGSRPEEVRHMIPFAARVAELLGPDYRYQVVMSPFMSLERVAADLARPVDPRMDAAPGHLRGQVFRCDSGVELPLLTGPDRLPRLASSALALSLPGTKTAEAACLGVPCVMMVPLNCPEQLPHIGPLGLLDWVPGGREWKGRWLLSQRHKVGLLAQPNQLLGRAVMPELVDMLTAAQVADCMRRQLQQPDTLEAVSRLLQQAYDPLAGCAERMLSALCS